MKKHILFLIICLLFAAPSVKGEVFVHHPGEWTVGVGIKTSTPGLGTDWGEFNVSDDTAFIYHDAKPGTTSIGYDLQVLYFIKDWLALGLSVGDEYFDYDVASGLEMDVDTRVNNFLFTGRIFLNPSKKYKVYIPFGIGLGHVMTDIDMSPEEKFHYTGFAGNIGLGVERLLSEKWGVSAELRYNYNKFHDTQTNAHGHKIYVYPSLNYISLSLRADYRF